MKKMILAMLLILPGISAQAGVEIRSMTDIGVCTDGTKTARFLDGQRIKMEQFTHGESDYRSCALSEETDFEQVYACGVNSWELRYNRGVDLQVRVTVQRGSMPHQVELFNEWGQSLMQGTCSPHKM